MDRIVEAVNSIIWSPVLVGLCLATGVYYSIRTRFLQIRLLKVMCQLLFHGAGSKKGISPFQALALALSGRVGTANVAGVAAAIGFGGPGAIFWMWVVAFFGAATAFVESTLAQIYKEEIKGEYRGGPAFYLEKATGSKAFAITFALATIVAGAILLPGIQSNSIGNAVALAFGEGFIIQSAVGDLSATKLATGGVVVVLLGFIIFGGVRRIAAAAQYIVPFVAIGYIATAVVVVALNIEKLPGIISLIVSDAFSPVAGLGAAIGWGVKRGVYSNEAGFGLAPHAAAAAEVNHPAQQGLVQSFSVYVDTLFVGSATAFMILIAGTYNVHGESQILIQNIDVAIEASSPSYTQLAIESALPGAGSALVAIALFFFAFTTLLAIYYYADTNIQYLGRHRDVKTLGFSLKVIMLVATFYGTVRTADVAWGLGDIGVGVMGWINIIGILIITIKCKPALKALRDFEEQRKNNKADISFDPIKLDIAKADFWVRRNDK